MSLQNLYTKSIQPKTISEIKIERFDEFMGFFERDCNYFCESCSNPSDLEKKFREIKRELVTKNLFSKFSDRTYFHIRLNNYRFYPVHEYLKLLYDDYNSRNLQIYQSFRKEVGKSISLPPTPQEYDLLIEHERKIVKEYMEKLKSNYIRFMVGICGLINSIFFAFESECKISCSLGCLGFSILFARGEIIQHGDIWRTLKRLGSIDPATSIRCEICLLRNDCMNHSINYEALANVYCYAIKVRMLSDYEDLFFTSQIWEKLKVYFDELKSVINSLTIIRNMCLGIRS